MTHSESDTRAKYIDPQLQRDGWIDSYVVREYAFTNGRKFVGGRGKQKYADYLLKYNGVNLAIIEAKKYDLHPTEGLEQVKQYGKILHVRYLYATNGQQIYEFDLESGTGEYIDRYPTPQELYHRIFGASNHTREILQKEPYYISSKRPRYYQEIAISKVIDSIADEKKRILLTLATGTGKTVIAFQIAYKLFMSRWSRDGIGKRRPRILVLADRNILVDQAMNTFNPLEKDIIKINGELIKKKGGIVPTNANIFFAIYQALAGGASEENPEEVLDPYYNRYDPDFFDLVIIDECHRGGAKEDGNWGEILRYFSSAVHLGLTATPKRDDNIDTYKYFGTPIYEYSLAQGINDGFLTPFKIKRIKTTVEEIAITSGDHILRGEVTKNIYTKDDFEKNIIIEEMTDFIAQTLLDNIKPLEKTIIFCVNQDHALRMRDSINRYKTIRDSDYCVRVTSNEGDIGRAYLERFQDNEKTLPTILTSSQMLTTGVDAPNVRNIVLVRNIKSQVEYKQIIGRGTRLYDGKDFFTVIDFVGATNNFSDEDWMGSIDIEEEVDEKDPKPPKENEKIDRIPLQTEKGEKKEILLVRLDEDREFRVLDIETRYIDPETGKLLSSRDFLMRLVDRLPMFYQDERQLREIWSDPETREDLLSHLADIGIGTDQLEDLARMFEAEDSDIFDILAHLSYGTDIRYRTERRDIASTILDEYESLDARAFLEFLLTLYVRNGILEFRRDGLAAKVALFGRTPRDLATVFGSNTALREAYYRVQESLYVK